MTTKEAFESWWKHDSIMDIGVTNGETRPQRERRVAELTFNLGAKFERSRAEVWKQLALDAATVLNAHAVDTATQEAIERAETDEASSPNTKGEARGARPEETMDKKQTIDAVTSLPQPLGSACECQNWADLDLRARLLTGHHARCPRGGNPLEAAFKLLKELTRGIECWANEEDGEVYADCWKPYREAKALEGVFLPAEPEQA